ncbi:unnamed protein product [Brassica oleracea var. botrytis]
MMEQEIMETINYHPTVIISGKTGCGKTSQVPQVSSFMKLALAQSNSVLEVWLSVLHSHVAWLSSPLTRGWLTSLVFVSVKKSVSKLSTTKKNWLELIYQVL